VTHLLVAVVVGFLGGRLVWLATAPLFRAPVLARTNWRGRTVPTAAGLILALVALVIEAARGALAAVGAGTRGPIDASVMVVAVACAFAAIGAVDDVGGSPGTRGFRGHLGAVARGRFTTGLLKLVGGAVVAVAVVSRLPSRSPARLVADAALIALSANLGNLLDRAPGRVIKAAAAAFAILVAASRLRSGLDSVAVVIGASLGLLLDDLHEHLMLGDAGANALGAVLGLGVVLGTAPPARTGVLVAVAMLNVAGEMLSFSRVIDAVPPLRALDRAGRRP